MERNKKIAVIVGILFIVATAATIVSGIFFQSIHDPNYLTAVSANTNQVLIGVLFMSLAIASVVGIPVALYPILKKHNQSLAFGYLGARIFEGVFFGISAAALLSILSLSQEFVGSIAPVVSYFETSGDHLLAVFSWSSVLLDIPFALSALILNYLLFRMKLIPRWLSGWGFVGGALLLVASLLGMFGLADASFLGAPIAVQEMALAAWLIIKGFNSSAIEVYSTKN